MIAVIGDVHGCFYSLQFLYSNIRVKYPDIAVYCTGDLIDRGNFSDLTVEFCIENDIRCVQGNHEMMFSHTFLNPGSEYRDVWLLNDPQKTLLRYTAQKEKFKPHLGWVSTLPLFYLAENTMITHAGVSDAFSGELAGCESWTEELWGSFLEKYCLESAGCLWNRRPVFPLHFAQVVGHTKQSEPKFDPSANTHYIDTGAYLQRRLTAIILEGGNFIEYLSVPTLEADVR